MIDIPSSNFMGQKGSKLSKNSRDFSFMNSVPQTEQKHKDPGRLFQKINLPDKYKQVIGPNEYELAKYKKKAEKRAKMMKYLKMKMAQREQEIKKQKVENDEQKKLPTDIFQDSDGRIRDKEGNVINLNRMQVSTLNINKNKFRESRIKEQLKYQRAFKPENVKDSFNYDNSLKVCAKSREKRVNTAFHFIEKGSIVQKAELMRSDDVNKMDQRGEATDKQQILNAQPAGIKRVGIKVKHHDPIPDFEWWDQSYVEKNSYLPEEVIEKVQHKILGKNFEEYKELTSKLLEMNPLGMKVEFNEEEKAKIELYKAEVQSIKENPDYFREQIWEAENHSFNEKLIYDIVKDKDSEFDPSIFNLPTTETAIQTRLTETEKKKLRRERRVEYQKEIQEKIKYGLIQPPPPKVKMSNFMKIMNSEAALDPTKIEKEVKQVIQERQDRHLQRNQSRKLTKDQKQEKFVKKIKRDSSKDCKVLIFKFKSLFDHKIRNKINTNAEDLQLNGWMLIPDKRLRYIMPNCVIAVEGGPKYTKFFKKLILNRQSWNDSKDVKKHKMLDENDADDQMVKLVWEGSVRDKCFPKWNSVEIKSELEGRKFFADRGVQHYWDLVVGKC